MDTSHLPWHLLQSFGAICTHGSLSAAARATNTSQPTLSRHLAQLEDLIGSRLVLREAHGLVLTSEGGLVAARAAEMADAAARVTALHTDGDAISGTVRITASQIAATYLLPAMLTSLHTAHPALQIELVASDRSDNLLRREADLAVRMYRPTQGDLITRKVADLPLGIFASRSYVKRRGMLAGVETLRDHDIIGYDRSTLIIDGMRAMGIEADRSLFTFRSDDQVVCWQMVKAGMGIGFGQIAMGRNDPDLVRLLPDVAIGALPVWLTAHPDLRMSPRVRCAFDHLATSFTRL